MKEIICKECGKSFSILPGEERFYISKGMQIPKRCKECRRIRKEQKIKDEKRIRNEQDESELQELTSLFKQKPIEFTNPDKSLVIIGNGFDIMHGVKSSYWEFQKTLGKKNPLRWEMETYLETGDLWSNLEESLGRLNYSMLLNPYEIDMWLDAYGAYNPDCQAADFTAAFEEAIAPTFNIPRELNSSFKKWLKTLKVESDDRPFSMLHGDYKVLSFNYTEFIETLYGAKRENICYIHGCRKTEKRKKSDEIILGHKPGMEKEQWDKVELKPFKFRNPNKRYIMESAMELAAYEASWYDDATTKNCNEIIKNHQDFFNGLSDIEEAFVIGHSLSEVDYPYYEEVNSRCNAKWHIGYHSLDDLKRLIALVDKLRLKDVDVFRT